MPRRKKEDEVLMSEKDRIPRGAANARERTRMRVLSKAFGRLKLTLPWVPADTKLSKLDTLRLATSYISHLKQILTHNEETGDTEEYKLNGNDELSPDHSLSHRESDSLKGGTTISPLRLQCWPYGHHRAEKLKNSTTLPVSSTVRQAKNLGPINSMNQFESPEHTNNNMITSSSSEGFDNQYHNDLSIQHPMRYTFGKSVEETSSNIATSFIYPYEQTFQIESN